MFLPDAVYEYDTFLFYYINSHFYSLDLNLYLRTSASFQHRG